MGGLAATWYMGTLQEKEGKKLIAILAKTMENPDRPMEVLLTPVDQLSRPPLFISPIAAHYSQTA